ncbi:MAG: hypothetical protein HWE27_16305 [Gammaproteobacteria bacterium]|nr:hypothetical protein [Gammaproteobacteria bacterium]
MNRYLTLTLLLMSLNLNAVTVPCFGEKKEKVENLRALAQNALEKTLKVLKDKNREDSVSFGMMDLLGINSSDKVSKAVDLYTSLKDFLALPSFQCTVTSEYENYMDGVVIGYIYPDNDHFFIYLTTEFFELEEEGFQSKLGVLIHEMSHFHITQSANYFLKQDEVYELHEALSLARNDPDNAISSASNIQYFFEALYFELWDNDEYKSAKETL